MTMRTHIKKLRLTVIAILILVAAFWSVSQPEPVVRATFDDNEDFIAGELVVQLSSVNDLAGVAAQYKLDPLPLDQFGSRPIYRLRIIDGARVEDRVAQLDNDGRVVFAEPNFTQKPP